MTKKQKRSLKIENENEAKRALLESLFDDMYKNRQKVFLMNFIRGLFFGVGTVLGGTVLVALIIWSLTQFAGFLPESIAQFIRAIVDSLNSN
jgi:uncharacterized BrkB/YihY/UPF0761 family membrane protein